MIGKSGRAYANPQIGRHLEPPEEEENKNGGENTNAEHLPPHIHIHSHKAGVTVHVMHHDGRHEEHEHSHGDAEGIAAHVHEHHGGGKAFQGKETPEEERAESNMGGY